MPRSIKPATNDNAICLANAIKALKGAREWMQAADCPKAMEALRDALKSAEGAQRHMRHRLRRTDEMEATEALDDFNYVGSRHHYG
jgi:hypothetical protein